MSELIDEIVKLREATEEQNQKMDELISILSYRNRLEKRNQLIASLKVYMNGSERVKKVIEEDYANFIEVCNECYHEILYEAIHDYLEHGRLQKHEADK